MVVSHPQSRPGHYRRLGRRRRSRGSRRRKGRPRDASMASSTLRAVACDTPTQVMTCPTCGMVAMPKNSGARVMALGLMLGISYEQKEMVLEADEIALFHSDRAVEEHKPHGEIFGF